VRVPFLAVLLADKGVGGLHVRGLARDLVVVRVNGVVQRAADPVRAPGQVVVPGQEAPLSGPVRVPIQEVVLVRVVVLVHQDRGDQVVQGPGQIHAVEEGVVPDGPRRGVDAAAEVIQVLPAFPLAGLLLRAAPRIERVVHLVEGPVRIQALAFEQLLLRLLDEDLDAVELPVSLGADRERLAPGTAAPVIGLEREGLAEGGLVAVGAVEPELVHRRHAFTDQELGAVVGPELEVSLRQVGRASAADCDLDVVVEPAEGVQGPASTRPGLRGCHVLHEPMKNGQGRVECGVLHHGPVVLGGVRGIGEERITRALAVRIEGPDRPPDHVPRLERVPRDGRRIDAVAGHRIRSGPIVRHDQPARTRGAVEVELDDPGQVHGQNRSQGLRHPGRDHEVLSGNRGRRVLRDLSDRRPNLGQGCGVGGPRGRLQQVALRHVRLGHPFHVDRHEFRKEQQIRAVEAAVQCLKGQQVVAVREPVSVGRDVELLERHRLAVLACAHSAGIPGQTRVALGPRGVGPGHLVPIQVGHKAVLVPDAEDQSICGLHVLHAERNADVHSLVDAPHRAHVQTDQSGVVVSDAGPALEPQRVVQGQPGPGQAERALGRDQGRGLGPRADQDRLRLCAQARTTDPVGDIGELAGIVGVGMGHGHPIRFNQGHGLPGRSQRKSRVEFTARVPPVLARCKDHQGAARTDLNRWKPPLGQVPQVVREIPAVQVHRSSGGIVDLDPVRGVSIPVAQASLVGCEELTDHQGRAWRRQGLGCGASAQGARPANQQHDEHKEPCCPTCPAGHVPARPAGFRPGQPHGHS